MPIILWLTVCDKDDAYIERPSFFAHHFVTWNNEFCEERKKLRDKLIFANYVSSYDESPCETIEIFLLNNDTPWIVRKTAKCNSMHLLHVFVKGTCLSPYRRAPFLVSCFFFPSRVVLLRFVLSLPDHASINRNMYLNYPLTWCTNINRNNKFVIEKRLFLVQGRGGERKKRWKKVSFSAQIYNRNRWSHTD